LAGPYSAIQPEEGPVNEATHKSWYQNADERIESNPSPTTAAHQLLLCRPWPPLQIHLYKTFGLALQASVAHGRQPALRLTVIFKPAIFHRLMQALAYVVEHDPGFFVACHGKTYSIGTTVGRHMATSAGIADVAELA
jgi:hypothetical protein